MKLTAVQHETLIALANGAMLTFDEWGTLNLPTPLPGRNSGMLEGTVRAALMNNKLIERRDKTKDPRTKGNGYVISAKGVALVEKLGA